MNYQISAKHVTKHTGSFNILLLIKKFRNGPVMGPRSVILARGRRPWANTTDRGPITGPVRNYLINDNFMNKLKINFELSIETRLSCLYGLEKKQGVTSSLLAYSYWPSCVSIGRVALYRPSLSLI